MDRLWIVKASQHKYNRMKQDRLVGVVSVGLPVSDYEDCDGWSGKSCALLLEAAVTKVLGKTYTCIKTRRTDDKVVSPLNHPLNKFVPSRGHGHTTWHTLSLLSISFIVSTEGNEECHSCLNPF